MIVGYANGRSIDARLKLAALKAAIERRQPPPGCIHHSDRGSQYAAQTYRTPLEASDPIGLMGAEEIRMTAKAEISRKL